MTQDHVAFSRRQMRRISYVTSQLFWQFPGLTRAPFGLMFLLPDLTILILRKLRLPISVWWYMIPLLATAAGCILASLDLRRYYARRFGRILAAGEKPSVMGWLRLLWLPALVTLYLAFASHFKPPFYAPGFLLALYYLNSWLNSAGLRVHRGIASGLVALLSLLPVWGLIGVPAVVPLVQKLFALELLFGGLCDHILLVRSFRLLSGEIHEHSVPRAC